MLSKVHSFVKEIRPYTVLSFLFISLLFLIFYIAGFQNIGQWDKSIKDFLISGLLFTATQYAIKEKLTRPVWILSLAPAFLNLAIYGYVILKVNESWNTDYVHIHIFFLIACYTALSSAITLSLLKKFVPGKSRTISLCFSLVMSAAFILSLLYLTYYLLYGDIISAENVLPVIQTNPREAWEFITDKISPLSLALYLSGLLSFFFLVYRACRKVCSSLSISQNRQLIFSLLLLLFFLFSLQKYMKSSFPLYQIRGAYTYIHEIRSMSALHHEILKNFKLTGDVENSLIKKLPGSVILVIGESAAKDRMKAFTPGYSSDTTPWLSSVKNRNEFYLFDRTYSCYPVTVPALSMFLYGRNQYDRRKIEDVPHIIDVAKKAGYTTWWISNQGKMSGEDSPIDFVAHNCDFEKRTAHTGRSDYQAFDLLKEIPAGGNHFIVIHLMGSHIRYADRLPPDFKMLENPAHDQRTNEYDSTLLYTDRLLRDILSYGKEKLNLQVMMYCSDHGENMKYSHVASKNMTYDMVRIPFFIYLSPDYLSAYKSTAETLRNNEHKVFTNDLMYDTISGILQLPNTFYEPRFDLSHDGYDLKPEEARTKHGEWDIVSDPDYGK